MPKDLFTVCLQVVMPTLVREHLTVSPLLTVSVQVVTPTLVKLDLTVSESLTVPLHTASPTPDIVPLTANGVLGEVVPIPSHPLLFTALRVVPEAFCHSCKLAVWPQIPLATRGI